MELVAERVAELMKLLANKHRLLVLCQLAESEKSVGELARLLETTCRAVQAALPASSAGIKVAWPPASTAAAS